MTKTANSASITRRAMHVVVRSMTDNVDIQPVKDWTWNSAVASQAGKDRLDVWEAISDLGDKVFPLEMPWTQGMQVRFDAASETARILFVAQTFDPNELWLLGEILEPGMCVVDVGANIGMYALEASRLVGPNGKVICFEPSRREVEALLENLKINRCLNTVVVPMAVGSENDTAVLAVASPEYSGHNSLAGLSIFAKYPNIRYTSDDVEMHWTGFSGKKTEIMLGKVEQIEIVIYSEEDFDMDFTTISVVPFEAITGPWDGGKGKPLETELAEALSAGAALVTSFGNLKARSAEGKVNLSADSEGGGISLRWKLDPDVESRIVMDGLPRSEGSVENYRVGVTTLDHHLSARDKPIDVLKIDVEGMELDVLKGSAEIILNDRPMIVVEVANELLELRNKSAQELAAHMHGLGYIFFDVKNGKPRLVDLMGDHANNVIAVPERFLDQVLKLGGLTRAELTAGLDSADPSETVKVEVDEACSQQDPDRSDDRPGKETPDPGSVEVSDTEVSCEVEAAE